MTAEAMLACKTWAVIGASANSDKFGYRIYQRLKSNHYQVFAVNPLLSEIDGDPVYPSLTALPVKPDVIDMVVTPHLAAGYLREAAALGIGNVWFQPGTFDETTLALADELGLVSVQACVLVASRRTHEEVLARLGGSEL